MPLWYILLALILIELYALIELTWAGMWDL